ncbi:hypothetical protein NL676_026748 [Syzygium grande]|nr:hypothetical protein NL676_026748 [Syzygium grande]
MMRKRDLRDAATTSACDDVGTSSGAEFELKTRLYLGDLEKHEEKFGRANVRRWKEALTQVARIKGWGLKDKGYGEIINTIVDEVFNKLKKRRRNMPDRLVGIHDRVEAIKDLLKEGCGCPEIALDMVKMKEGTNRVVALNLTGLSQAQNFTSEEFSKLPNLRFLELEGGNMVGDFKNLLSKLIWLSWSVCPLELKATNLCLKKLAVLELSGRNITENWPGWGPCLVSEKLKVIRITGCSMLKRIPDFSKCLNLKRLVIQGCETLLVVDGSLSKLEHLKHVQINSQRLRLQQRDEFEQLPELPVSLKELKLSSHLLPTVPDFSYLTNLVHLHIWSDNPGLSEGAPKIEWIKGLSNLERLTLVMRDVKFPLINWATLSQLRILEITCVDPQSMLGLPSSLEKLTLHDVNSPMERSLFCDLTNLSSLELCKCRLREVKLDDVLVGQQQEKLHSLEVRDSELLERLSLQGLKGLQYLRVSNCPGLTDLEGWEESVSLEKFSFLSFKSLGESVLLHELSIIGDESLEKIPDLSALEDLRRLYLTHQSTARILQSYCGRYQQPTPERKNNLLFSCGVARQWFVSNRSTRRCVRTAWTPPRSSSAGLSRFRVPSQRQDRDPLAILIGIVLLSYVLCED